MPSIAKSLFWLVFHSFLLFAWLLHPVSTYCLFPILRLKIRAYYFKKVENTAILRIEPKHAKATLTAWLLSN